MGDTRGVHLGRDDADRGDPTQSADHPDTGAAVPVDLAQALIDSLASTLRLSRDRRSGTSVLAAEPTPGDRPGASHPEPDDQDLGWVGDAPPVLVTDGLDRTDRLAGGRVRPGETPC